MSSTRCKAKGRVSKAPCRNPPVTGREVCRMHGGATPRGSESPHFKHGLYSRYAPAELAARIAELRQDEERLHDLREVLAVQGALLAEALQQGDLGAAAALTEAVSRSIDRYHKHHPPEGSPADFKLQLNKRVHVTFGDDLTDVAVIDAEIDRLLAARHRADPNSILLVDKSGESPATICAAIDDLLERLHRLGEKHPLETEVVYRTTISKDGVISCNRLDPGAAQSEDGNPMQGDGDGNP